MRNTRSDVRLLWLEFFAVTILTPLVAGIWIQSLGGGVLSWDSYNHHVVLGMQALHGSRLQHDVFALGGMSCQYPMGYAPMAAMLEAGITGKVMFTALAAMAGLAGPAFWLIVWRVVPGRGVEPIALRVLATALAMSGVLWWKVLPQSSNDMLALVPGIWSVACGILALCLDERRWRTFYTLCLAAGALSGIAVAIKLSMFVAPLAALLPLVMVPSSLKSKLISLSAFLVGAIIAVWVCAADWALDSWLACGTPVYPFLREIFSQFPLS